jgi:hypothetical protein
MILSLPVTQLGAQVPNTGIPEYTDAQRWGRMASLNVSALISECELGKSRGMTIDEIGTWLGNYYAEGWAGGLDARGLAIGFRWNWMSDPRAKVEMTVFSDTLVVMRANMCYRDNFGPARRIRDITLDEINRIYEIINRIIADHVGVKLESRIESDWWVLTFRNGYGSIRSSDHVRWIRSGAVTRFITLDVIRTGKAAGKTPRETGLETAKAWADTWTNTDTPWRLLRGIAWNNYADPEFVCNILSASPVVVKAQSNRPWITAVRNNEKRSGVTVDEYEAYLLGIEQGIAASRGMTWEVILQGDDRIITVRKK